VLKILHYTNDVLRATSLAIPVTSTGILNVQLLVILSAIYRALKDYANELQRNHTTPALHVVYLVCDQHENTSTLCYGLFGLFNEVNPIPPPPPTPSGRNANRRRRLLQRVEGRSQAWTHETLAQKQKEDPNLRRIVEWLSEGSRPEWNNVHGFSPAEKAYWHQFETLSLTDGVIYRKMSPATEIEDEFQQLLMPCGLRTEFLDAIHRDLAGHLGVTKTAAHIMRRAYWFNWHRDVNLYVKKCKMCCTYKKVVYSRSKGN